eukprot:332385-Prorocentrum_minimum.AAC.1
MLYKAKVASAVASCAKWSRAGGCSTSSAANGSATPRSFSRDLVSGRAAKMATARAPHCPQRGSKST